LNTVPVGIEFSTIGVLDKHGRMHDDDLAERPARWPACRGGVWRVTRRAWRRDFTINAIAYDPIDRVVHDPFGGQDDLARRLVRAVGDPDARMLEDRLRALRAIRFASRFAFDLEAATWQ
jgi:tRNA nucleotidyltransferase/poly(A) polymerase